MDAAFEATRVAAEQIDMTKHLGEHPRIGATDVVPFVPVSWTHAWQECVQLARSHGKRCGDELMIPVYLYEEAATRSERRNLACSGGGGEYEGLSAKLSDPCVDTGLRPGWRFSERSGATVTGAACS